MNILFLGTKLKLLPIYDYVREDHNCRFIQMAVHSNNASELDSLSYGLDDESIFDNWVPDAVVNLKEQAHYLEKEKEICERFGINTFLNEDNIRFFSSKAEQDIIWKELHIPTVPNNGDTVICKSDLSGGTGFKVVAREEAVGFFQNNVEIEYIVSCHLYADSKKWYWLNNHVMRYDDNCPARSYTPYEITDADYEIIEESIWKLSNRIQIQNKLFGWQFMKDTSGNIYSIDFNLRPFGGWDKGSYDWDISDEIWSSYLFDNKPPTEIKYLHSVECVYTEKQKFGYAPWDRLRNKLQHPYTHEVLTYDNI